MSLKFSRVSGELGGQQGSQHRNSGECDRNCFKKIRPVQVGALPAAAKQLFTKPRTRPKIEPNFGAPSLLFPGECLTPLVLTPWYCDPCRGWYRAQNPWIGEIRKNYEKNTKSPTRVGPRKYEKKKPTEKIRKGPSTPPRAGTSPSTPRSTCWGSEVRHLCSRSGHT